MTLEERIELTLRRWFSNSNIVSIDYNGLSKRIAIEVRHALNLGAK